MDRRRFLFVSAALGLGGGRAILDAARAADATPGDTLAALVTAHRNDAGDAARYAAFAKKADEEGYLKVAQLFRATGTSMKVHADRLAETITKLGGAVGEALPAGTAATTKENLTAALGRETGARKELYAKFYESARQAGNKDAVRVLNYAKASGEVHAKYYKSALEDLDGQRAAGKGWWVCTVCGYTVSKVDFLRCLVCFNPKEKYVQVV